LATELVYGSLRLLAWLEARIARHAKRGIDKLDPLVRAHLVVAAYQIFVLTRVPAFAAVSEAVSAVRAARGVHVAGFANAVLRKVAAEPRPSPEELARVAFESTDPALRASIVGAIGEDAAVALLGAHEGAPPHGLRIEDAAARDEWLARLREARPQAIFETGRVSPHAVLARSAGKLVELPGYAEGAWTPQEEGSQVVALALGARSGDVVLDACAGRGNKTGLLARAVGPSGAVDAADVHPKKLDRLTRELERIACRPRATFAVDWSLGAGGAEGGYDRILVDAPCSGTGTIRRRPELALRRSGADVEELARLQRAILLRAATLVKPGGRVVYAVCSVLREEAEEVLADVAGLEPIPFDAPAAIAIAGEGATKLRLLPHQHGTDGYFVASLRRL
ncbi:MAG: Ribosomal small subunit methyltransferase, partial [Labilithrix sp.]|nr:Ribosomal small subunit methyltransferase [Labilithrix sp.]